jgi:hypothetical protein
MYVGRDFDPIDNNSGQIYGFDLSATLTSGSNIIAVQSKLILESGFDDTPETHLVGAPEAVSPMVTQMLFWGGTPANQFIGNTYVFFIAGRTNLGEVIIPWGRISVQRGYGSSAFVGSASPLAANVFVIPVPRPLLTLPSLGGYALQDFPDMDQGEHRLLGFDFAGLLSPGEDVVNANVALTTITGNDPIIDQNPTAYFAGSPILSGSVVQQLVAIPPLANLLGAPPQVPDLRGVVYALSISGRSSYGQAISTWSRLRVRSFYA